MSDRLARAMAGIHPNANYTPPRAAIGANAPFAPPELPPTPTSTVATDPNALAQLAEMLRRGQAQRVAENTPPTMASSVRSTPPPLPPYQQPGSMLPPMGAYMQQQPQTQQPNFAAPQPNFAASPPMGNPAIPQTLPPWNPAPGSMPPVTMGQQAPMMGRNELERDYYRQLAENPNGFGTGWMGRQFG